MSEAWCDTCQTRHRTVADCPGELVATGDERHGWRVLVRFGEQPQAVGVLVAPCGDRWRARLLTYPNMLWSVPGRRGTMKFVDLSAAAVEQQAIRFLQAYCESRGFQIMDEAAPVPTAKVDRESRVDAVAVEEQAQSDPTRHLRFLPIGFGAAHASERQGLTSNLSEEGLFVITEQPLPTGATVRLSLELDGFTVPLQGEVIWQRIEPTAGRPAGMGVRLRESSSMYRRHVRSLSGSGPTGD